MFLFSVLIALSGTQGNALLVDQGKTSAQHLIHDQVAVLSATLVELFELRGLGWTFLCLSQLIRMDE